MKRKPLISFTLATLAATALLVVVPLAQARTSPEAVTLTHAHAVALTVG
ncbi:MAG: hypothetical protein J0L58_12940 [Burkholderiales bacterium]|nr:hypothetical protein [Burkholderiales bacterium]